MNKPLSYKDAGVDIDAGDALVERIKPMAAKTLREGVLSGLGGFGALFEVPKRYQEPVLVSGTDGVGTKLKLAFEWGMHDSVGIDLVAMSVNDVLVQGAEPLFFLDYFACGKLDVDTAATVVQGIATDLGAIGYSGIGYKTSDVHTLALGEESDELVEPSYENCVNGEYPLARFLYVYVNKKPGTALDPLTNEFLKFVLSKEGQEVVVKDGYFPLPKQAVDETLEALSK